MDPIIITGVVIVLIILFIRIFFGMAKFLLKIGLIILVLIVIWRVFFVRA